MHFTVVFAVKETVKWRKQKETYPSNTHMERKKNKKQKNKKSKNTQIILPINNIMYSWKKKYSFFFFIFLLVFKKVEREELQHLSYLLAIDNKYQMPYFNSPFHDNNKKENKSEN